MPAAAVPFPTSSIPGVEPNEGSGRLINVQAENKGDKTLIWRPVPGLEFAYDSGETGQRGFLDVVGVLYGAFEDTAYTMTAGGVLTLLTGDLDGTRPVTWARNNKSPTPDVVAVDFDNGAYTVTAATVTAFADADLQQPNSVSHLGGYFIFTIGNGRIYATGLNVVTVDALSFTTAESNPDGLIRGWVSGEEFYAAGTSSIEVYDNQGTSPFPLRRKAVIPVGLLSPFAVAGFGTGWDQAAIFVAQDCTVRKMQGYDPIVVSKPDVVRDIQSVTDKYTLKAHVYVVGDHAHWVLSCADWTWVYDVSTDEWLERRSHTQTRWRGDQSVKFNDEWIVGDTESGELFEITERVKKEGDSPLVKVFESGPVIVYPQRLDGLAAFFYFTTGQGVASGDDPIETDPVVTIEISRDGGNSWGTPIVRSLGQQGNYKRSVRVNRLGQSTHHGLRFRLTVSDPIHLSLQGGVIDKMDRAA